MVMFIFSNGQCLGTSLLQSNCFFSPFSFNVVMFRAVPRKFSWEGIRLAFADKDSRGRLQMVVTGKIWRALHNETLAIW